MLEADKLFSFERAKRGAKISASVSAALWLTGLSVAGILHPELIEAFSKEPDTMIKTTLIYVGYGGAIGAVIDSFKPSAWLVENQTERAVQVVKDIKNAAVFTKIGLSRLWGVLSETNYKDLSFRAIKLGYDFARPNVPEWLISDKRRFITRATLGASGATLVGTGFILAVERTSGIIDQIFNQPHSDLPLVTFMADHPLETIAVGTLVGFGVSSYISLFHRPINPYFNQ